MRRILPNVVLAIRQEAREVSRDNVERQCVLAAIESKVEVPRLRASDATKADTKAARRTAEEFADAWLKAALAALEKQAEATDGQSV